VYRRRRVPGVRGGPDLLTPQGRSRALECRSAQPDFGCSEVVVEPPWCVYPGSLFGAIVSEIIARGGQCAQVGR